MSQRRTLLRAGAVVGLALLLALTFVLGSRLTQTSTPGDDSADAGFLRDMQFHHAQAVEMSVIVRDNTEDPRVRQMALDIALGQQQQMGQMFAILESWGLSQQPDGEQMAWMAEMDHGDHGGHGMEMRADGLMPGMATAEQLQELREASGVEAERLFLELMITHHEAGVEMAEAGMELSEDDQVDGLAWSMQRAQSAEITTMQRMLEDRAGS